MRDRARQIAELGLRALRPALSREAAATDGDQRLALVPADAAGIVLVGIDEAEDAVALLVVQRETQPRGVLECALVAGERLVVRPHVIDVAAGVPRHGPDQEGERAERPQEETG